MNQIKRRGQAAESVVLEAGKNHGHRWGRAFAHNGLKSSVQNTARALAGFADWKTGRCFPAIKTLAAQTNQSQRTVQNHLRTLEAAGWIQVQARKRKNGSSSSNQYQLSVPARLVDDSRADGVARPSVLGSDGVVEVSKLHPPGCSRLHPHNPQKKNNQRPPQEAAASRAHEAAAAPKEPGKGLSEEHKAATALTASLVAFLECWRGFGLGKMPSRSLLERTSQAQRETALAWLLVRRRDGQVERSPAGVFRSVLGDCFEGTKRAHRFSFEELRMLAQTAGLDPERVVATRSVRRSLRVGRNEVRWHKEPVPVIQPTVPRSAQQQEQLSDLLATCLQIQERGRQRRDLVHLAMFAEQLVLWAHEGGALEHLLGVARQIEAIFSGAGQVPVDEKQWVRAQTRRLTALQAGRLGRADEDDGRK